MVTILAVKRRSPVERRIIPWLRGETEASAPAALNRSMSELRVQAIRAGLDILPAGSTFVGRDELALLGWLASAQRVVPRPYTSPDDADLAAVIRRCASLLDEKGMHLPPLALYGPMSART